MPAHGVHVPLDDMAAETAPSPPWPAPGSPGRRCAVHQDCCAAASRRSLRTRAAAAVTATAVRQTPLIQTLSPTAQPGPTRRGQSQPRRIRCVADRRHCPHLFNQAGEHSRSTRCPGRSGAREIAHRNSLCHPLRPSPPTGPGAARPPKSFGAMKKITRSTRPSRTSAAASSAPPSTRTVESS